VARAATQPAWRLFGVPLFGLLAAAWLALQGPAAADQARTVVNPTEEPIAPVPPAPAIAPEKIRLGEQLFRDPRLSRGNVRACASCHLLDRGGDDDQAHSLGSDRRPLDFNTPTVFNVALDFRLNWRGNFLSLQEQNASALLDPRIMNTSWVELLQKLRDDARYRSAFARAYGGELRSQQVLEALVSFERSLQTPDARFDRYLRGDRAAITRDEEEGYRLFKSYGCTACHQGVGVGGNLFQRFGIFDNPFAGRPVTQADLGRFTITGVESDRHVFRVPSLRNVALTAPYFHDGSAPSLEAAVAIMARVQLGRTIDQREIALIAKFLRTLTGEYQGRPSESGAERARP
jgi:cytochrome c peroxidase